MPGNRRHIPREQKQLVVIMANYKAPQEIADATQIHVRTVRRILQTWRTTGNCIRIPLELGRPRILTAFDVDVGLLFLGKKPDPTGHRQHYLRTPDIYTFELQRALLLNTGLNVAKSTIRDAIIRRGYTRKTVRRLYRALQLIHIFDRFLDPRLKLMS
ncbi:hypothetical protein C8R44DRAFT_648564 [Mycena epipterygia]|nr:hypothetical protein C8R44DRAFT_648564 [Mycena epipterygia]